MLFPLGKAQTADGIGQLSNDPAALPRPEVYDLSGRRVASGSLGKGIYIINGKKYIK